ncbi:MAG: sulfite exporter TauE/SafE family protein [Alphaproteobacteria bacterium]|nr:sulfite exporter TauE/SafE family protein [Alphaproteobacteria bacterium]
MGRSRTGSGPPSASLQRSSSRGKFVEALNGFIPLDLISVVGLFLVGFVGGMVSGFIGSGGAFVLTPAMMSMGVPGIIAVASNMCHKFPKALVGAIKRAKYGHVDVKLGLVMGCSAEAGVLIGAHFQEHIRSAFGEAGSNLYVSVAFVVVLGIVGTYVMRDAWHQYKGDSHNDVSDNALIRWVHRLHIPGTMVYFPSIGRRISVLVTIPMGFATGMLAATIAVGGFVGVPSMMYGLGVPSLVASGTELVIAFVMGLGGTIKFAWGGFVDIRLAMIILAGSLFGIHVGAIGTTYVKPYMVKVVMGVIMLMVLVSRGIILPVYLSQLELIPTIPAETASLLKTVSFDVMVAALVVGATIVILAMIRGARRPAPVEADEKLGTS